MTYYRCVEPLTILIDNPVGHVFVNRGHARRTADYWVLGFILDGECYVRIGEDEGVAATGEFYLLPPHILHYGNGQDNFEVLYFHFLAPCETCASEAADALPLFGKNPAYLDLLGYYDLFQRGRDFGYVDAAIWNRQLEAMLDQIRLNTRLQTSLTSAEQLLSRVLDYLRVHAHEPLAPEAISAAFGYSYDHLDRLFRQRFGVTLHRRHAQLRFEIAAQLIQTGHSLKEAARGAGFVDYYYFLKAFKRERGCTPGEFARRLRRD